MVWSSVEGIRSSGQVVEFCRSGWLDDWKPISHGLREKAKAEDKAASLAELLEYIYVSVSARNSREK